MYGLDHRLPGSRMNLLGAEAHQSRAHALARQARGQTPGWLSRSVAGLVGQLGSELVALGKRLEQHAPARPLLHEGS